MLAVVLLTAASAHATIVAVQANAGMASSASSEAVAFSSNTTAGNIILVGFDFRQRVNVFLDFRYEGGHVHRSRQSVDHSGWIRKPTLLRQ